MSQITAFHCYAALYLSQSLCHFGLAQCRSQCVRKTPLYAYSPSTAGFVKLSSSPTRNSATKASRMSENWARSGKGRARRHTFWSDASNDGEKNQQFSSFIDNALRTGSTPSESGPSGTQQATRSGVATSLTQIATTISTWALQQQQQQEQDNATELSSVRIWLNCRPHEASLSWGCCCSLRRRCCLCFCCTFHKYFVDFVPWLVAQRVCLIIVVVRVSSGKDTPLRTLQMEAKRAAGTVNCKLN